MNKFPQSIEEVQQLLESGASFNMELALERISGPAISTSSNHEVKNKARLMLIELVQSRFDLALEKSQEASFMVLMSKELEQRLYIRHYSILSYIQPVIGKYFHDKFIQHLKDEIAKDSDIDKDIFIERFVNDFSSTFLLDKWQVRALNLKERVNYYFPSADFHSVKARSSRNNLNDFRFQRELSDLNKAKSDGQRKINNTNCGNFDSGKDAENAWVKVMREYFGEQFEVLQDKPIHVNGVRLPKFDIIMIKKDHTHRTPQIRDFVDGNDVVAAFEVKRTIRKHHVDLDATEAINIFDDRCIALKKSVMPEYRLCDRQLTPYQMLHGKIYFGVLGLDIEEPAIKILFSGENHAERHRKLEWLHKFKVQNSNFHDYAPDIIYCPGNFLWAKEVTQSPFIINDHQLLFFAEDKNNDIDSSVSSFGYLISSMRRFFIAQGHIRSIDQDDYIKPYENFYFLRSENSRVRYNLCCIDLGIPAHIRDLSIYLSSQIPNEYSDLPLSSRKPLQVLKQWSTCEAKDIIGYVKHKLKKIVELEQKLNYQPLPIGVNINDDSFDRYVNSMFS